MAVSPGPTSGVGSSPFEHHFICVRSLIRHGGEDAVRLVIDDVCRKHWRDKDKDRAQLQLELLAYTVLRIRDPDHFTVPDPGFELVRQQLVEEVQQECMDTDHEDKKIVARFVDLLRSVEPRTYLWPPSAEREVDLDEYPLPENSRILQWDEKNNRLIYLPEAEMKKQLGIGTAPGD